MRKFFPAANTPYGFFSRFDSIYNEKEDKKVIYIKGGSGTGKSTLMKKLIEDATKSGIEVEQFLCSSDPDSLDGVRFISTKTAIVDATSPHVQDPSMPGISGEIYNIADFWDDSLLTSHKEEIIFLANEKKNCFNMCYRYLKSAQALYPAWNTSSQAEQFDFEKRIKIGKTRYLFASGITPKGNINLLDKILIGKITGIEESPDSSAFLKEISQKANNAGYDTELYFCPMFPTEKAEHLVIPDLKLSFTTLNDFHSFKNCDEIIYPNKKSEINPYIKELISAACDCLTQAKTYHVQIEQIYISAMDFNKMNATYKYLKNELLN